IGALLLPGESSAPMPVVAPPSSKVSRAGSPTPVAAVTPIRGVPVVPALGRSATPLAPRGSQNDIDTPAARRPPTAVKIDAPTVKLPKDALGAHDSGPIYDLSLPYATPVELAALAEQVELGDTERRRVLAMSRLLDGDPHALLGVAPGADARSLKRA